MGRGSGLIVVFGTLAGRLRDGIMDSNKAVGEEVEETVWPIHVDPSDFVNRWLEEYEDQDEEEEYLVTDSDASLRGAEDMWSDVPSDSEAEDEWSEVPSDSESEDEWSEISSDPETHQGNSNKIQELPASATVRAVAPRPQETDGRGWSNVLGEVIVSAGGHDKASVLLGTVIQKLKMYLDHCQGMLECLNDLKELLQDLNTSELDTESRQVLETLSQVIGGESQIATAFGEIKNGMASFEEIYGQIIEQWPSSSEARDGTPTPRDLCHDDQAGPVDGNRKRLLSSPSPSSPIREPSRGRH